MRYGPDDLFDLTELIYDRNDQGIRAWFDTYVTGRGEFIGVTLALASLMGNLANQAAPAAPDGAHLVWGLELGPNADPVEVFTGRIVTAAMNRDEATVIALIRTLVDDAEPEVSGGVLTYLVRGVHDVLHQMTRDNGGVSP